MISQYSDPQQSFMNCSILSKIFFFTVIKMVPSSFLIYQTPPPSITLEAILLFLLESYKCDCVYRTILLQQCSALEIRDFIINYYYHK